MIKARFASSGVTRKEGWWVGKKIKTPEEKQMKSLDERSEGIDLDFQKV
jgi:hypothetical protein